VDRVRCAVVGVDPGESTGVALLVPRADGDLPHSCVSLGRLKKPGGNAAAARLNLLTEMLREPEYDGLERPPIMAVEDPGVVRMPPPGGCAKCGVNGRATRGLGERVGMWKALADERTWRVVLVHPRTWQAKFIGGRQEKHDLMVAKYLASARARFVGVPGEWMEDTAAAAHVALFAAEGLGEEEGCR
jgi:hypothetical protein